MDQAGLCLNCWADMQFITQPICDVTGTPLPFSELLSATDAESAQDGITNGNLLSLEAMHNPPIYDKARVAVKFNDVSRKLIHKLKYQDQQHIAPLMAKMMVNAAQDLLEFEPENSLICPVPLYHWRYVKRRFNQADMLARHIAKQTKISYMPQLIKRQKATKTQVGLSRKARQSNVKGAFVINSKWLEKAKGKRLYIVDDVVTTGATVDEIAKSLKKAGLEPIYILAFAKVIKEKVI